MKTCRKCHISKSLDSFMKRNVGSLDGHRNICKDCQNAYNRMFYRKTHPLKQEHGRKPRADGLKTCLRCKVDKKFSEFSPLKYTYDHLQTVCKPCMAGYARNRRLFQVK